MKKELSVPYNYKNENRERLKDILPLQQPLSVIIETASACNFKCKFCIHGNAELIKEKRYVPGIMKYELFTKIIDDIAEFKEPLKYLSLHDRGEPLLNPRIVDMVKYIKQKNVAKQVSFNTNGSLLTKQMSIDLVDAGLDSIRFSIEAVNQKKYEEVSNVKINFEELVENIRFLYNNKKQCYIYIKIINYNLSEQEKDIFYKIFSDICDDICIEEITDSWKDADIDYNQELNQSRFKNAGFVKTNVCPRIFFTFTIHHDGVIVPCGMDWEAKHAIGNANNESVKSVWNGNKMNAIRRMHLEKREERLSICEECPNLYSGTSNDNIDDCTERLIDFYK